MQLQKIKLQQSKLILQLKIVITTYSSKVNTLYSVCTESSVVLNSLGLGCLYI